MCRSSGLPTIRLYGKTSPGRRPCRRASFDASMGMKKGEMRRLNLDALIKQGHLPWRPRPEARDLDVWHQYESPLTGTFRIDDALVLFTQVLETGHGLSAWAYVCLSESDERELEGRTFASVDELDSFVAARFCGHEAVLALATDDQIDSWTRKEVHDGLLAAVEAYLNDLIAGVNKVPSAEQRVLAKFAGVEAAHSELASA